jgi:hypothetical protein
VPTAAVGTLISIINGAVNTNCALTVVPKVGGIEVHLGSQVLTSTPTVGTCEATISDTVAPTATLTLSKSTLSLNEPATLNIVFSESVIGLTITGFNTSGCTVTNLSGSGANYTATLTPTVNNGGGVVVIKVGAAADLSGNLNTTSASTMFSSSKLVDQTAPTAVLSLANSSLMQNGTTVVNVVFSEAVTGLTISDFSATNASVSNLTGSGDSYTMTMVAGNVVGTGVLSLNSNAVQDEAGNANTVASSIMFSVATSDSTAPTVSISLPSDTITANTDIPVTVTFSESVTGLTVNDFFASNATITNLTGSDANYTLTLTPNSTLGAGFITLNSYTVTDLSGNYNTTNPITNYNVVAADEKTIVDPDSTPPVVTITLADTNLQPNGTTLANIDFSEPVTGLTLSDFFVGSGTASDLTGSGANYTLTITANSTPGSGFIILNGFTVQDMAGNWFITPTSTSFTILDQQ